MILVFLDFDGVTHPWPTKAEGMFDANCLGYLNEALSIAPVEIIVSSTWRESMTVDAIKTKLGPLGNYVSGVTPVIDEPFVKYIRYQEIDLYLTENNKKDHTWLAIDDEQGNFPDALENVLITDRKTGFSKDNVQVIRNMLSQLN